METIRMKEKRKKQLGGFSPDGLAQTGFPRKRPAEEGLPKSGKTGALTTSLAG
jgi:hypothetical protein